MSGKPDPEAGSGASGAGGWLAGSSGDCPAFGAPVVPADGTKSLRTLCRKAPCRCWVSPPAPPRHRHVGAAFTSILSDVQHPVRAGCSSSSVSGSRPGAAHRLLLRAGSYRAAGAWWCSGCGLFLPGLVSLRRALLPATGPLAALAPRGQRSFPRSRPFFAAGNILATPGPPGLPGPAAAARAPDRREGHRSHQAATRAPSPPGPHQE